MRVVTYSRVSTLAQESEGESLANQERAFARALDRSGWTRVKAYREAASAGTVAGRTEFLRMIDELPQTRPDVILVDTLDRFTRNLRDGLSVLETIRGHHVGLLPLDWRRERPINVDDDRDWSDVVEEFTAAERERRRIRRRVLRSFEGRRERGATTVNRPPFGLRKQGDRLVPNEDAEHIREIDRRLLAGHSAIVIARSLREAGVREQITRRGVMKVAENHHYVDAGVRTRETQDYLDAMLALNRKRFGFQSPVPHQFSGVFACGVCYDENDGTINVMAAGGTMKSPRMPEALPKIICSRSFQRNGEDRPHARRFSMAEDRIIPAWRTYLERIAVVDSDVDAWAAQDEPAVAERRRRLERQVARLDQREAAIRAKRDRAVMLLGDPDAALDRQARAMLREIDGDELALRIQRDTLAAEMETIGSRRRDAQAARAALAAVAETYMGASERDRNRINRLLCEAFGHPILRREGGSRWDAVTIEWPGFESLLRSTTARDRRREARQASSAD